METCRAPSATFPPATRRAVAVRPGIQRVLTLWPMPIYGKGKGTLGCSFSWPSVTAHKSRCSRGGSGWPLLKEIQWHSVLKIGYTWSFGKNIQHFLSEKVWILLHWTFAFWGKCPPHLARQSITKLPESELWKLRCKEMFIKCLYHAISILWQSIMGRMTKNVHNTFFTWLSYWESITANRFWWN